MISSAAAMLCRCSGQKFCDKIFSSEQSPTVSKTKFNYKETADNGKNRS